MPDNTVPKIEDSGPAMPGAKTPESQVSEMSENDIIIHSIPKRFLNDSAQGHKAKNIGLLILVGGGIFLVFGVIFTYLYLSDSGLPFLKKTELAPVAEELSPDKKQPNNLADDQEKDKKEADQAKEAAINPADLNVPAKTSADNLSSENSPDENEIASTSASAEATSTIKTISGINPGTSTANFIYPSDSDQDGLFDNEENIFGSQTTAKDSDGDGYDDLAEVFGLYDPAGLSKIIANKNIDKYTNNQYRYSLYYPLVWKIEKAGGDESVIFNSGDNQFVQAITVEKDKTQVSLNDWYKTNTDTAYITNDQIVYKKGWEGIKSPDGLNIYLTKPNLDFIIIMTYNLGTSNILSYKNIYMMMVNSLEINQ